MRRYVTLLAAGTIFLATFVMTAPPADAHIELRSFEVSPSCTTPGGTVHWSVTVKQTHWYHVHTLYARVVVSHALTGLVLYQQDEGPQYVPGGTYSASGDASVPDNAPPGDYLITLSLGDSPGDTRWGSTTRTITVQPLAALCG